jgi:hypothetical protein
MMQAAAVKAPRNTRFIPVSPSRINKKATSAGLRDQWQDLGNLAPKGICTTAYI